MGPPTNARPRVVPMADLSPSWCSDVANLSSTWSGRNALRNPARRLRTPFCGLGAMIVPPPTAAGRRSWSGRFEPWTADFAEMSAKAASFRAARENGDQPVFAVHKDALAPGGGRGIFRVNRRQGRMGARNDPSSWATISYSPPVGAGTGLSSSPPAGLKPGTWEMRSRVRGLRVCGSDVGSEVAGCV